MNQQNHHLENVSKSVIIEKVKANQALYLSLPLKWRKDSDVAMAVIKENAWFFDDLDSEVKNNSSIVKFTLEKNGSNLASMSDEIKNTKEWVMLAMKESVTALYYASDELQNDKELLDMLKQKEKEISKVWKDWLRERMDVLKIYEEEKWMQDNVEKTTKRTTLKKF